MIDTPVQASFPRRTAQLLAVTALLLAVPVAAADGPTTLLTGTLTLADGQAASGFRVVLIAHPQGDAFVSGLADGEGRYVVAVPSGGTYQPVAVITPRGRRIALEGLSGIEARPGVVGDLQVPIAFESLASPEPRRFAGADRLYLAFVEDVPHLEWLRFEANLGVAFFDAADAMGSEFLAAWAPRSLSRVELGARAGVVRVDFDSGDEATGPTDLEAWARYHFGTRGARGIQLSAGALLTLPTGDEDTGSSFDALRSAWFVAGRLGVGQVTISAHAGLRFNEDAEIGSTRLDGVVAPFVGGAVLWPLREDLVLVSELRFEAKRFEGAEADARLLVGATWKRFEPGMFRFALATGLSDGAPDAQLLAGYAFVF